MADSMAEVKMCVKCLERKPVTDFSKKGFQLNGTQRYRTECRSCIRKYAAGYDRQRYSANQNGERDKRLGRTAQRRALKFSVQHEPYSRAEIFSRWDGACAYCDGVAEHIDHVHPISRGGADAPHNLVPACAPCNLSKGAKTLAEWSLTFGA
jgi:5-methylcytosine-specific restriction endonuclease McrA